MEDTAAAAEAKAEKASSYRYWVREATGDAAPLPVPRKLDPAAAAANGNGNPPPLGSVWNQAGTWEEKNLNSWANSRIKDLLGSLGSLDFPTGKASIDEVSKCSGDLQVRLSDDKGLASDDKTRICKDLKSFLTPIQEKMRMFEEELKGR
nr:unnamed protein product [Digitaria exilis]